jgi:hypothetical protein
MGCAISTMIIVQVGRCSHRTSGRMSDEVRSDVICRLDRRTRRDGGDHQWASACCGVLSIHQLSRELRRKAGSPARRTSGCACCGTSGHTHESRRSRQPCRSPLSITRRHAPLDHYHAINSGCMTPTSNKGGVVTTPPTRMTESHYVLTRLTGKRPADRYTTDRSGSPDRRSGSGGRTLQAAHPVGSATWAGTLTLAKTAIQDAPAFSLP